MKKQTPTVTYLVTPASRYYKPVTVSARLGNIEEARRKARQFTERRHIRDISEALMADIAKAFAAAKVVAQVEQLQEAA